MSSVIIAGNTSGSVTLSAPDVAGTTTLTLPARSGTVMVNGAAFSAYNSNTQTPTVNTWTKLQLNTETFDTNNNFDSTTNYRFTPTVAGYYQINGSLATTTTASTGFLLTAIRKNGSEVAYGSICPYNNVTGASSSVAVTTYLNGSTDYVEFYFYEASATVATQNSESRSTMSGALVRAA